MVEESCRIQLSYNNTYILNTGPITNIMQVSDFHSTLFRMLTTMAFIQVNATRIAKRVVNWSFRLRDRYRQELGTLDPAE